MPRSLVKSAAPLQPPKELAQFFDDPPLALNEKREEYENLFAAIAAAAKPGDAIAWLLVRDFTDLSWEIQREKNLKRMLIEAAEERAVADIFTPQRPARLEDIDVDLVPTPGRDDACETACKWATYPEKRQEINKALARAGYEAKFILFKALSGGSQIDGIDPQIDKIDRRIAAYEQRRYTLLRTIEQYSEKLARRVETASPDIIEGQFTEAAE